MVLWSMKRPRGLPVPSDPHRPEGEDGLGAGWGPAHPGRLQALWHAVPTGPFHHPGPDGPTARQRRVVGQRRSGAVVGAPRPQHGAPGRLRAPRGVRLHHPRRADRVRRPSPPRLEGVRTPVVRPGWGSPSRAWAVSQRYAVAWRLSHPSVGGGTWRSTCGGRASAPSGRATGGGMDRASRRAPRGTRRVMATAGPSSGACRAGPLGLGGAARTGRAGSCSRAAPTAGGVRGDGALGESPVTTAAGCVGCVGPGPRRTAGGAVAGGPRGPPVPSAGTPRIVPPVTGGGRVGGWSEQGGTARAAAPRLVARAGRR